MLTSFGGFHAARRASSSPGGSSTSTFRVLRSMRMRSPVFSSASPPPTAASGETFRIDGEPDVPDCRPSPIVGSVVDAALQQRRRRLHVHHLGAARIADRAAVADDQHRLLLDAEIGILDAVVVVLRPFEHDRLALEHVRALGIRQEAPAEFLIDDADLHHRAVEQVARHHDVAGGLLHRIAVGADHLAVAVRHVAQVLAPASCR